MEREKPRPISDQEARENLNGRRIVYRFSDEDEGRFRIVQIKSGTKDKVSRFVFHELEGLEKDIKRKRREKVEASQKKKHGQSLSKREVTDIRKNKLREIRTLEQKKQILSGQVEQPIVFTREEDEITGSDLSLTHRESHWWSYIKEKPELMKLDTEDYGLLTRSYFIRYDLKFNPSHKSQLDKDWDEVRKLLREEKEHLVSYVVDIVSHLT